MSKLIWKQQNAPQSILVETNYEISSFFRTENHSIVVHVPHFYSYILYWIHALFPYIDYCTNTVIYMGMHISFPKKCFVFEGRC